MAYIMPHRVATIGDLRKVLEELVGGGLSENTPVKVFTYDDAGRDNSYCENALNYVCVVRGNGSVKESETGAPVLFLGRK